MLLTGFRESQAKERRRDELQGSGEKLEVDRRRGRGRDARDRRDRPRERLGGPERARQRQPGLRDRRQPRHKLRLLDRDRERVAVKPVGSLGGVLFRRVDGGQGLPGPRANDGSLSTRVNVLSGRPSPRTHGIYNQTLPAGGYGYLTTRDGTQLAISVRLPGPVEDGPYPTLVEYSGYGYANPAGAESGISQVGNLLGYAVVDVNMRGTGCSGGSFDFFERLQALDGYDVIETVARQPWALHNKVGMVGVSYGGISQLFVGSTSPPSLSAIAPLSVLGSTATTLYPGGILNTGFAVEWAEGQGRRRQARLAHSGPALGLGPDPGRRRDLRGEPGAPHRGRGPAQQGQPQPLLPAEGRGPPEPGDVRHKIKTPVFLACQFNDEQTGPACPNLADRFTGTKRKWFTFTNGLHIDSLDPETFNRWFDFLELYVAQRRPVLSPLAEATAGVVYASAMGVPGVTLPPDPIQDQPTYESAKNAFESLPPIRILFDSGAGGLPGHPVPAFERSFNSFPIPGTKPRSWYLGEGDALLNKAPRVGGSDTFEWDKESRPADNFAGTDTGSGDLWTANPSYDWRQPPAGTAASYLTAPLASDNAIIGAGALHAWIRASVPDVDLQVTVSEVRPDGKETYVQSGWLRSSLRDLNQRGSTLLEPVLSLRRETPPSCPRARFEKVIVPLYYQGHVYRAGSRIRVTVTAPSGDQPVWSFAESIPAGDANVTVSFSRKRPSRLILPLVPGVTAPTPLPQCPALRGEPCRTFSP